VRFLADYANLLAKDANLNLRVGDPAAFGAEEAMGPVLAKGNRVERQSEKRQSGHIQSFDIQV